MPAKFPFETRKTNIVLPAKDMEGLKALSKKTGAPIAELIRRACAEYIQKHGK